MAVDAPALTLCPDQLLPTDPAERAIARRLNEAVHELPVISPHGHVDPRGVRWWFFDAPDAIRRFRAAVTETAGLSRTCGFVDDTRASCSMPARHDVARWFDAGFLARLVAEHRLGEEEAAETAIDLVSGRPRKVFML